MTTTLEPWQERFLAKSRERHDKIVALTGHTSPTLDGTCHGHCRDCRTEIGGSTKRKVMWALLEHGPAKRWEMRCVTCEFRRIRTVVQAERFRLEIPEVAYVWGE